MIRFAEANGVVLRYLDHGPRDAQTVVFLHPLGADLHLWDAVAAGLAATHRVISYDLRGHAGSEVGPGPITMDSHVGDLIALLDRLGVAEVVLAGISVGGLIAQAAAIAHPKRFHRLVLCATGARIGSVESWSERIRVVTESGLDAVAQTSPSRWFAPGFVEREPATARGWQSVLRGHSARGYTGTCAVLRDTDLRATIGQVRVPTLVITGEHDPVTPPALGRELAAAIPGAEFVLIRNAAHLPPLEKPAELIALLTRFLA
jgi:3-oxoadipate enol-lactonase